jgi:uncharacterized membrane protein YphA (DoxX/SURF4 family)/peroxiredoxin
MNNFITQFIRIIVAVTFIFSGFVKLIDPLGSAYKFEEYLSADVLNMEFLTPYSLHLSVVLILLEISLGTLLLLGCRAIYTLWGLFLLTLIFLFLTWYSAEFNKVTDCGCFGDAVKLSPWETFYKNVVLIVLIVYLMFKRWDIQPIYTQIFAEKIFLTLFIIYLLTLGYVRRHLRIIDFRPYAVGENIKKGMEFPPDAEGAVYEDTWIYKVNGEEKEFTTSEKPWEIEGATYVDRITKTINEGYVPPIHDFTMERNGEDLTDKLLQEEKLMLVVMYDLRKTKRKGLKRLKKVTDKALNNGYLVYAFSASTEEDFQKIKEEYQLDFDLLFCDGTTLKTMIRANPGIVILNKGTVTGKWNWRDFRKIRFKD